MADSAATVKSGAPAQAAARRYRRFRYAINALAVGNVGVVMVGSFMVDVRGALLCYATAVVLLVLMVLAHLGACVKAA